MQTELYTQVLPAVSRSARYLGNEYNSIRKDWAKVPLKMALAFPDVYDVGMGHLGLKILYHIVNRRGMLWPSGSSPPGRTWKSS